PAGALVGRMRDRLRRHDALDQFGDAGLLRQRQVGPARTVLERDRVLLRERLAAAAHAVRAVSGSTVRADRLRAHWRTRVPAIRSMSVTRKRSQPRSPSRTTGTVPSAAARRSVST